ncbi:MAG: hypothetical protein ACI8W8_002922 [Rhodothermales bacterium]|jgi:hypothetical protein
MATCILSVLLVERRGALVALFQSTVRLMRLQAFDSTKEEQSFHRRKFSSGQLQTVVLAESTLFGSMLARNLEEPRAQSAIVALM